LIYDLACQIISLCQSLQLLNHDAANLLDHPLSIIFILLTFATVIWTARGNISTPSNREETP